MDHAPDINHLQSDNEIFQRYIDVEGRAVHYRLTGTGPAVVLLHDSPRSSRLHLDTMRALSQSYTVYALDTPGYGNSAPLGIANPTIVDFARALASTLARLGLDEAPLYATHTSAKIALEYAASAPRTAKLILDGLSIPAGPANDEFIAKYMRPVDIEPTGGYLAMEWTRMRDMVRWFPWFTPASTTRMAVPSPTDAWLADYAIDFFSAGPHYSDAYKAAMYYNPMPALLSIGCPTMVAAREDDVLYGYLNQVPAADNPNLSVERLGTDRGQWLDWLHTALAVEHPAQATRIQADQSQTGCSIVRTPFGVVQMHRAGPRDGIPLLILSTPTILQGREWQQALAHRPTLLPELPGFGESSPLFRPTLAGAAEALLAALDALDIQQVNLLASSLAAPLAMTLAQAAPSRIRRVILDGCPLIADEQRADFEERIAPVFPFDALGGAHNHRYWHMLRDSEANFPWFSGAVSAQRTTSPLLSAASLHEALLGILKQPEHYGDIARAACRETMANQYPIFAGPCLILNRQNDPAYAGTAFVASRQPNAAVIERAPDTVAAAAQISEFLESRSSNLEQGA